LQTTNQLRQAVCSQVQNVSRSAHRLSFRTDVATS